jgi:hypothetical protein
MLTENLLKLVAMAPIAGLLIKKQTPFCLSVPPHNQKNTPLCALCASVVKNLFWQE